MKNIIYGLLAISVILCAGCQRNRDDIWEDTKSASRHVNRGAKSLAGKQGDSRAVNSRDQFLPPDYDQNGYNGYTGGQDFIPLPDYQGNDEELWPAGKSSRCKCEHGVFPDVVRTTGSWG